MKPTSIISVGTMMLGASQLAAGQGFIGNCTWQGANTTRLPFLGMYCNDDQWDIFGYKYTWFNIDQCLINNGGTLVAHLHNGDGFFNSCRACTTIGSYVNFNLTCDCFDIKSNLNQSTYDLNKVLWNHDGALGCYNHIGNKSERPDFY